MNLTTDYHLSLVKGSHILIPKLYSGEHGYFLQNQDKRMVFILPYHGKTMVGTTEVKLLTPPEQLSISPEEISYLLEIVNTYFKEPIEPEDIQFSWSGVRPLIEQKEEKPQTISRDYALRYTSHPAPALVVYGGKITTYRQLAKEAVNALKSIFPHLPESQTDKVALPGSQTPNEVDFLTYRQQLNKKYNFLEPAVKKRLFSTYGTRLESIIGGCATTTDLGQPFGHGLYQAEVDYLIKQEWAQDEEDILWRRTKLGLEFNLAEKQTLSEYIATYLRQLQSTNY